MQQGCWRRIHDPIQNNTGIPAAGVLCRGGSCSGHGALCYGLSGTGSMDEVQEGPGRPGGREQKKPRSLEQVRTGGEFCIDEPRKHQPKDTQNTGKLQIAPEFQGIVENLKHRNNRATN